MKKYILLLFLTSCTPVFFTEPSLATPPSDQVKYHADLKACEEEQKSSAVELITAGLIPGMVPVSTVMIGEGKGDDIFKSRYTIRDECMVKKGYVLAK